MNIELLQEIRSIELRLALREFPPRGKILEVGAGAGWQARRLMELGYDVVGIDLNSSNYRSQQVFPVTEYDGSNIPFNNSEFDVVYSSNVLEHVAHKYAFQREIRRVLKPGGIAVHVMPSSTFRIWSNITFYIYGLKYLALLIKTKLGSSSPKEIETKFSTISRILSPRNKISYKLSRLTPKKHGEFGNIITETYYFSRYHWTRVFQATGWTVVKIQSNRLFYSGYMVSGLSLSIGARSVLSRVLGSSCIIYTVR